MNNLHRPKFERARFSTSSASTRPYPMVLRTSYLSGGMQFHLYPSRKGIYYYLWQLAWSAWHISHVMLR